MKILHCVSSGGLFGAERVILSLAGRTHNQDIAIVGALENKHNPHLEMIDEAKKLNLPTATFPSQGRVDISAITTIKNYLIDNKIDILHTHNYKADIVGCIAAFLAKKKWVATNHLWHSRDTKLKFYETIDAFFLKFASKVVGVSQEIVDDLINKGFDKNKLKVIHNGIKINQFDLPLDTQPIRETLNIPSDNLIVGIIGRLDKEKGHSIFLQAAKTVLQSYQHVTFLIIGDGPLKQDIEQEIKTLNLSNHVICTGIRRDIPFMYKLCHILVNASYAEGLPMTILEAMAARLPIIATRVGAVPNVINNNINGLLIDAGDSAQLSSALLALLTSSDKRKAFAQQAYTDVCEKFSDERMAFEYTEIYRNILKQG